MKRPYMDLGGSQLLELVDASWEDYMRLSSLAVELQYRSYITGDRKAAVIRRLSELFARHSQAATGPGFEFPTTDIVEVRRLARMRLGSCDWRDRGLLAISGYHVGTTNGRPERERRRLLNFLFLRDDLRDVDDRQYAAEWGTPMSSARLQKMSESIAAFARNGKRSPNDLTRAVTEWEEDLEYLRGTFYDRWGDFPWPSVLT